MGRNLRSFSPLCASVCRVCVCVWGGDCLSLHGSFSLSLSLSLSLCGFTLHWERRAECCSTGFSCMLHFLARACIAGSLCACVLFTTLVWKWKMNCGKKEK